jgi:hypothetical protein
VENTDRLIAALSALAADMAARPLPPANITAAAVCGDVAAVRAFLDGGADIEEHTIGFASPLAAAASRGHLDVVKLLVERGANLDPDGSLFPLFTFAISNQRLDVVEYALKAGAPVAKYRNHFREAVKQKHWDMVDAMLAGGADPGWLSNVERAQLDVFVTREQPRSFAYREKQREQQARRLERERVTPSPRMLTDAERARHEAAALAEVGRDPALARARTGNATPVLALAVSAGAYELVRCLLAAGADPDDGGAAETPLARAAARSDGPMLEALLAAGAGPNRSGPGSPHPLLAAALAGSLSCVETLLARGARPRAKELKIAIDGAGGPDAARIAALLGALQTPAAAQKRREAAEAPTPEPRKVDLDAVRRIQEEIMDMGNSIESQVFSSSGTFENLTQTGIQMSVEIRGGVYASSVTKKTNVLVAGAKAGAKLEKAKALGVRVMTEAQFHALLDRIPITETMKRRYLS